MNNNSFIIAVKGEKSGKLGIVFAILFLILMVVCLLHFSGTIDVVKFMNENLLHKKELNVSNNKKSDKVSKNDLKAELFEMCNVKIPEDTYSYDRYEQYIYDKASELTEKPSEGEIFEIMSGMGYCVSGSCLKLEKDGTVNMLNCDNKEYLRMSYDDFQEYMKKEIQLNLLLNTACANVDGSGYYVPSEDAGDYNLHCEDFICTVNYSGFEHKKDCRID